MKALTQEQVDSYRYDGFLSPFDVLSPDETASCLAGLPRVESFIGSHILVWTSPFFIKEANSPTFAAWHQDSTYFGLDPDEQVTAWVALTDASQDAGCIEVLSAHGKPRQMRHVPKKLANSINRTGQTITEPLDDASASAMPLKA